MVDLSVLLSRTQIYKNLEQYVKNKKKTKNKNEALIDNISCASAALVVSLLSQKIGRNVVVVAPNEVVAQTFVDDVSLTFNQDDVVLFKSRDMIYSNIETSSMEYEHQRLRAIYQLLDFSNVNPKKLNFVNSNMMNRGVNIAQNKKNKILVVSAEALHQPIMSVQDYENLVFNLKISQVIKIQELSQKLIDLGFVKSYQVDGIGQFAVRGEIVDIFPPHLDYPVRLDFWDDEIDSIFLFDIETQRKIDKRLENVFISPAREILINDKSQIINSLNQLKSSVSQNEVAHNIKCDIEKIQDNIQIDNIDKYINQILINKALITDYVVDPVVFLLDYDKIIESSKSVWWHYLNDLEILTDEKLLTKDFGLHIFSWEEIENKLRNYTIIKSDTFDALGQHAKKISCTGVANEIVNNVVINNYQKIISPWHGDILLLENDIRSYQNEGFKIIILTGSESLKESLLKELREKNFLVSENKTDLDSGFIFISNGALSTGVEYYLDKIAIITVSKNINQKKSSPKRKKVAKHMMINSLEDISVGDYVVHVNHGIGVFDGIDKLEMDGITKDYIKIKYQNSDILYLPVTQLDLVSKYIGNKNQGDNIIKLNKLGSLDWQKRKINVKKAVKGIAKDLIKLQSQRLNTKGFAFSQDTDWQKQFEDLFEYQETDAQLRCIDEIKKDMESSFPMDRLLCGDVGVGKTEVALRMAFKAVMDGKQVAILAPTTILSSQHYNTIVSRLNQFSVNVELLSRAKTLSEQKQIIKKLKTGEVEIVIGTHRLLQKDIEFKDLGLIIIDEEQRFGVVDKEKFKKLKNNVDILTLSATPIPRTLNMAMSGLKDMSVIDEMPQDRLPIQTYVLEYDESVVTFAIVKEMRRGGMVFYLHNNIESINVVAQKISKLVPEARVMIAHGKMLQNQLTATWEKLLNHEADVLICTTIIETGIDIPFCNTLIVEDADRMGLAQLHQLRGRIGRSSKRAFAYMTYRKGKALSDISLKRLNAIKEFTKFGSGFKIAMRDLEIRGAGDILGAQQHGHIDSVGYDMYLKLLSEAVSEEKGEAPELLASEKCSIDIKVTAYLPEKYITSLSSRIDIYKKVALIKTKEDYDDLLDELVDRFGEPPREVIDLLNVSLLRNLAIKNNIKEIAQKKDGIYIYQDQFDAEMASKICSKYKDKAVVLFDEQPLIRIKVDNDCDNLLFLTNVLLIT